MDARLPTRSAYIDALMLLGRRELSEAQVRQRLIRRGHTAEGIDAAVTRLLAERAIDDARVAEAIANTQRRRQRGRRRAAQELERAGIAKETARLALDRTFEAASADDLLEAALAKRLRGRPAIADDAEFRRLYRYLVGQGFEADGIIRALKRHA